MKGDLIPESDTIARYCPVSKLSEETGKPTGTAFKPSERDLQSVNPHISVNWLEYFKDKKKEEQIVEIRTILSKKMNKIGNNAKLSLVKVKAIYEQFDNTEFKIRILHWPDTTDKYDDQSHAGIFDIESNPEVIADMLALVESEMVSAKI